MSASAPPVARVLRFDTFELDLYAGELRKRGIKLRLQGQPVQVLAMLLQSAGSLVTREEIRNQLWHADTFVDFDHSLHNAIARIRDVLGDSAQTPKYIETLPRRGYRFIAPVEEVQPPPIAAESGNQVSEAVVPMTPAAPQPKRSVRVILGLCACAAIGFAGRVTWQHFYARSAVPAIRSIAVLPLRNLSGDASQEYFADALTDELITELSQIQALRVVSHTSVREYQGTRKHLPQIARELSVDDIVEGSVVREAGQVRVTVQLLDAPNDRHLWSEDYQRSFLGILSLQKEMAQAIAQQIRVKLTPQQQARFSSGRPVDPDAFKAYLTGRYYLITLFSKPQPLYIAKGYFEESIRKDPGFALAYVGLADSYINLTRFRHLSPEEGYRSTKEALRKALELDESVGEAHKTLALLRWLYERDWLGAERELNYALALTPSSDCAHAFHALYLAWSNQREPALAEITRSRDLNPGSSFASTESAVYDLLRDYPNLIEASRKGVTSDPSEWLEHYFLAVGYEGSGRRAEAIPEYRKAVEMSGGDQNSTAALAHAYALTGRRSATEKILRDLQRKSKDDYVSPYIVATVYAALGEKDTAFEWLEKAYRERCLDIVWSLRTDLRIDNLRSDPRFEVLLRQIGFPQ